MEDKRLSGYNGYAEAVRDARSGKEEAFRYLYESCYRDQFYMARQYMKNDDDAQDVLQEAYVKAWQRLHTLQEPDKFPSWFSKIVSNTALDAMKKTKPMLFSELENGFEDGETIPYEEADTRTEYQPEHSYTEKETAFLVREMIDSLSDEQRMCVLMHYIEGQSVQEIAAFADCSQNTVLSRLFYGRKNLKAKTEELEKKGYKLYGIAPLPLLLLLLRTELRTMSFAVPSINTAEAAASVRTGAQPVSSVSGTSVGSSAGAGAAGESSAGATAAQTAAQMAAKTAASKAAMPVVAKIAAAVAACVVIGTGAVAVVPHVMNRDQNDTIQAQADLSGDENENVGIDDSGNLTDANNTDSNNKDTDNADFDSTESGDALLADEKEQESAPYATDYAEVVEKLEEAYGVLHIQEIPSENSMPGYGPRNIDGLVYLKLFDFDENGSDELITICSEEHGKRFVIRLFDKTEIGVEMLAEESFKMHSEGLGVSTGVYEDRPTFFLYHEYYDGLYIGSIIYVEERNMMVIELEDLPASGNPDWAMWEVLYAPMSSPDYIFIGGDPSFPILGSVDERIIRNRLEEAKSKLK